MPTEIGSATKGGSLWQLLREGTPVGPCYQSLVVQTQCNWLLKYLEKYFQNITLQSKTEKIVSKFPTHKIYFFWQTHSLLNSKKFCVKLSDDHTWSPKGGESDQEKKSQ